MAATTKKSTTATAKAKAELLYDSKVDEVKNSNFIEVKLLVQTRSSRYGGKPESAKSFGQNLEDWLSDYSYDERYGKYRVTAKTLTQAEFDAAIEA